MTKQVKKHLEILNKKLPFIKETFNVSNIGIFGSYARGDQNKKSDIDIMVEFDKPVGFFKFIDLEDYLSKLLKKRVDLTTEKSLKPFIKKDILKETIYV